jgi:hypothetical protein
MSFDEAEHTVQLWPDTEDVPGLAGSGAEAVTVNAAGERSIKEVHFPSIVCFLPATPSTAAAEGLKDFYQHAVRPRKLTYSRSMFI